MNEVLSLKKNKTSSVVALYIILSQKGIIKMVDDLTISDAIEKHQVVIDYDGQKKYMKFNEFLIALGFGTSFPSR